MRWRVLVSSSHMRAVLDQYRPLLDREGVTVVLPSKTSQYLTEQEMLDLVDPGIDGIICSDDQVTARVLAKAPRLKVLSKWGTGVDSIDQDAAKRHGVRVYNVPGAFNDAVADVVMCYVLDFARRPHEIDATLREGHWVKQGGPSLRSLTLGIVGVGNIGGAVALRAQAFGMGLLGNDIRPIHREVIVQTGIKMVTLEQLLGEADVLTLNCDFNPSSRHLISDHEFALMKPGAIIINTARGPIIDETALVHALETGKIAGAALDVFEEEPLPLDSPLRRFSNVLLSSHNAHNTFDAVQYVHDQTIRNLIEGLKAAGN